MDRSIFCSVISYTPTPYMNPQENFLTELFAWIINNVDGFGREYIKLLNDYIDVSLPKCEAHDIKACTQITVSSGYIDMVIYTDCGINYICEHKVNSELSSDQIKKYMECIDQLDGEGKYYSVILTKAKWQHMQKANVSITWRDVDELIERIVDGYNDDPVNHFVLEQFSLFLKERGLGKESPMDADYFKNSYIKEKKSVTRADERLVKLFEELALIDWRELIPGIDDFKVDENLDPHYEVKFDGPHWGRIGIRFFSRWVPSIFAGVMFDAADHKLRFVDENKGPDFIVLLDIENKRNRAFNDLEWTRNMKARLSVDHEPFDVFYLIQRIDGGWRFFRNRFMTSSRMQLHMMSKRIRPLR